MNCDQSNRIDPDKREVKKQPVKRRAAWFGSPCWTRTNSRGLRAGRDASGLKPAPVASALGLLRLAESPTGRAQLRNR